MFVDEQPFVGGNGPVKEKELPLSFQNEKEADQKCISLLPEVRKSQTQQKDDTAQKMRSVHRIASTPLSLFVLSIFVDHAVSFQQILKLQQPRNHQRFDNSAKLLSSRLHSSSGDNNDDADLEYVSERRSERRLSPSPSPLSSRREWLMTTTSAAVTTSAGLVMTTNPLAVSAASDDGTTAATASKRTMTATWSALSGLESNDQKVVAFDDKAYIAMRDDKSRTPLFQKVCFK